MAKFYGSPVESVWGELGERERVWTKKKLFWAQFFFAILAMLGQPGESLEGKVCKVFFFVF